MILRLRQLCSHVLIIQGTIMDLLEQEDFERLARISSDDLSEESKSFLVHLREKLKDNAKAPVKSMDTREGATVVTETETVPNHGAEFEAGNQAVGGSHGLTYNFGRYLHDLSDSESWDAIACRTLCCGCRQPPADPHVTSCFHIYCHSCRKSNYSLPIEFFTNKTTVQDLQASFARRGMEHHRCNECGQYYSEAKRCGRLLERFAPAYDNIVGDRSSPAPGKKAKVKNWVQMYGDVLPSAKTLAVKAQILEWIEEDSDVKIIVYSQFMPMLNILSRICRTERWTFEKYTGSMSHDARDKAIENFGSPAKKVRILLASLKCGGLGLNLTMANRVITVRTSMSESKP
jgi:SNF2 family DNA or RNA helicase